MVNNIKLILATAFLFWSHFSFSQEKKKFSSIDQVLSKIQPNNSSESWLLVYNEYGKNREVKISGSKQNYLPQFAGFNFRAGEESFYYIVSFVKGNAKYITDIRELREFIGKVNNVEEAAVLAVLEGYLIDDQFVDIAANYTEDKNNYYLGLGKVTSTECPYQKKHFTLTVDKASGKITNSEEHGTYIELYTKNCKNNPRLMKIEKKEEPEDESKRKPTKRK